MRFHRLERLRHIHETNAGRGALRVLMAALIGVAVVAGITMVLRF